MKCYLLISKPSKSTILLTTYKKWCLCDGHLYSTYVTITQFSKGALGKIKNTSLNDGASLSKFDE